MRKNYRRGAVVLATMALAGASLAACGGGSGGGAGGSRVVIGIVQVPHTLDPQQVSDIQNDEAITSMYDTLVTFDANGKLVSGLSTSWEYAPDGKSISFTLHDGAKFHSGNPVTAADVAYTLNRIKKVNTGVAAYMQDFASATATDGTHLTISLTQPDLQFIGVLSKVYILDSKLVGQHEGSDEAQSWLATNDAGSGPYDLAGYKANSNLDLTLDTSYWNFDATRPQNLNFRYIAENSTLASELRNGGVDVVAQLDATNLKQFQNNPSYKVTVLPTLNETMVIMNTAGGVTADPRVREAIQLAYDYQGHLGTILGGAGQVATGLVSPAVACGVHGAPSTQNVAKAKQLVQDAGATGKSLTLMYQPVFQEHTQAATLMQTDLKAIGLNLTLKQVTFPQYLQMVSSADTEPDLAMVWDSPNYPQIGAWLQQRFASKSIGTTNLARYSNPKADELIAAGAEATDATTACSDFNQAQHLILDDHVAVTIANPATPVVTDTKVKPFGFDPSFVIFNPKLIRLASGAN
ncbi:ABC transporter substrate-binding protein [Frankia sp. AgB1.9]|uniref:ABC transporter substrate-binding protein n=1 Tax=unclassified Frankia TaxID=2632575 RepID=UPI0019328EF5|nr:MULTISPECIES: ABC transporter substrate-binding protein [unclassified Frankia]MBL7492617.1 ABC transporter substrate-binding protein [Frankia sp. AgW1.1]MBL7549320.1 ABC transporter substrate-binding protein [Frankia sp. AgB1.9]MBL7619213.1 ABC transporter substrate-binding protein [Frankia sp. AgB1.8]